MVLWWPLEERSVVPTIHASIDNGAMKDAKVRLYDWDGKSLKEAGLLEGNKGPISAIRFSPDGAMVVSGDVSCVNCFRFIRG